MKARLHRLKSDTVAQLIFEVPAEVQPAYQKLVAKVAPSGDWYDVEIKPPRKARSTGPHSQNSHAWGHCQQIANETGHDLREIEAIAKMRAVKRGYTCRPVLGQMIPISQADASTADLVFLIDEYHAIAAELDIKLIESED